MKYILTFIMGSDGPDGYGTLPGTMFEVDRFDTIEDAVAFHKKYHGNDERFIILPYYEIEK